jgi:hypothetical protein
MASVKAAERSRSKARPSLMSRLWRDYNLTIVVGALFAVSFVLHTIFGWWQ